MRSELLLYAIPAINIFTGMFYESATIPLLTSIVRNDKSGLVTDDNLSLWTTGFYASSVSTIIITVCLQGYLSDFYGYKFTYVLLNIMLMVGSQIQIIEYENIIYLLVGQLFIGFANVTIVSQAYIHSLTSDENSVRSQTFFQILILFGYLIGSVTGGLLDRFIPDHTWQIINSVSLLMSVVVLLIINFIYEPNNNRTNVIHFPCTKHLRLESTKVEKPPTEREMSFRAGKEVFLIRNITSCLISEFAQGMLFSVAFSVLSYILTEIYMLDVLTVSIVFVVISVLEFVFVTFVFERIQYRNIHLHSLVAIAILLICTCISLQFKNLEYLVACLLSVCISLVNIPCILTRVIGITRSPESKRTRIMALMFIVKLFGTLSMTMISFELISIQASIPFAITAFAFILTSLVFKFSERIDNIY